MGMLWRLLAPKPLKKARRSVRKAAHPVRTASWALSPKPVKQLRRGAFKVTHPLEAAEFAAENAIVNAARGGKRRAKTPPAPSDRPRTARQATGPRSEQVTDPALTADRQPEAAAHVYARVQVTYLPGSYEITVAGPWHHERAIRDTVAAVAAGADPDAILIPEPSNPHDSNAVAVTMSGGKVGYIPRQLAAVLQPAIIAAHSSTGRPIGCPARIMTDSGSPYIVLTIDIAELGIDPATLG